MRRLLAAVLTGAVLFVGGAVVGTGEAQASIVTGRYTAQFMEYGFIPTPVAHARIIGKMYYQDFYGIGPRNSQVLQLQSTKRGMIASYLKDPFSRWDYRVEYRKTRYGYKGVMFRQGMIVGDVILRKVR